MKDLRQFITKWRMVSAVQLRREAESSLRVSEDSLRKMMSRLRKNGAIRSCRMGSETVYFDSSLRKGADYINSLSSEEGSLFLKPSGIQHHLLMLDLAQGLVAMNSTLSVDGNVLTDTHSSSYSEHEDFFRKHAPDLTLSAKANSEGLLCYIEVERTLKAAARYRAKWGVYESDESVSLVLYWSYDRRFERRLQDLMGKYFRRMIGDKSFEIGTMLDSDFKNLEAQAPVKLFSIQGKRTVRLGELVIDKFKEGKVA